MESRLTDYRRSLRGARCTVLALMAFVWVVSLWNLSPADAAELRGTIRGVTVGPIENAYHPGRGYGSEPYGRTLDESLGLGANWVALTPFGRVGSLAGLGVDPSFEAPLGDNELAIRRAIRAAHARGLQVFLVPHLWVESYEWRALIDPGTDAAWTVWSRSYSQFVLGWARIAEEEHVELLAAGVELRSWVTTARAPLFSQLLKKIRQVYHGLVTYSANWDDVENTVILGELDVIGINAFYPLTQNSSASLSDLRAGGEQVMAKVDALSEAWHKPVIFSEIGYTTRRAPAVEPWLWPENLPNVEVSEQDQAAAYHGLLAALLSRKSEESDAAIRGGGFRGFFVWRVYADPDDASQEPEFGFSPRGKIAERVVRDAFSARWPEYSLRQAPGERASTHALFSGLPWARRGASR
jgi:hypothetical protein